jgi:hypothetical protein
MGSKLNVQLCTMIPFKTADSFKLTSRSTNDAAVSSISYKLAQNLNLFVGGGKDVWRLINFFLIRPWLKFLVIFLNFSRKFQYDTRRHTATIAFVILSHSLFTAIVPLDTTSSIHLKKASSRKPKIFILRLRYVRHFCCPTVCDDRQISYNYDMKRSSIMVIFSHNKYCYEG